LISATQPTHLTGKQLAAALDSAGFLGTVPVTEFDKTLTARLGEIRTMIARHNGIAGQKYERPASFDILGSLGEWVTQSLLYRTRNKEIRQDLILGAMIAAGAIKGQDFGYADLSFDVKGMKWDCDQFIINKDHHTDLGETFDFYLFFKQSECGTYASLYNIPASYVTQWKVITGNRGAPFHARNITKMLAEIAANAITESDGNYAEDHDFTEDADFMAAQAAVSLAGVAAVI
jgi:hypothetical protein